jgi:hypothetical protein
MVMSERDIFVSALPVSEIVGSQNIVDFGQPYEGYDSFNMSILNGKCCFRNSNFRPKSNAAGKHSFLSLGSVKGGNVTDLRKLNYRGYNVPLWDRYNGMEDPKLIRWRGEIWCLFVRPNHQINKIWMVLLNTNNGDSYQIDDPIGRNFTKNWMPLVKDDRLFLVTDIDPFMVYEFVDGNMKLIHASDRKSFPVLIHGSSNILELDEKFVGVVHGRFEYEPRKWFYWHSMMSWSKDWLVQKIGRPFYFDDKQIEFCMSWEISDGKVRIPYSTNDNTLKMISFEIDRLGVLL